MVFIEKKSMNNIHKTIASPANILHDLPGVFDGHGGHKGAFFATKKTGHNIVDDLLQVVRN